MSLRILIVDDSEVTRRILVAIVQSRQWTACGEAANGSSAIRRFWELLPDLVLVDLAMPDINGIEVARVMHRVDPTVPIIIVTIHDVEGLEMAAHDAGVYDIVSKEECWNLLNSIDEAAGQSRNLIQ